MQETELSLFSKEDFHKKGATMRCPRCKNGIIILNERPQVTGVTHWNWECRECGAVWGK